MMSFHLILKILGGGRKEGDGDLERGGAISLVRQLGDRQVGASPTDIEINFVTNQSC